MTNGNRTTRKRRVRASRARLYAALTDAGLKTQVALAERIADLEGLDAAPKDVVNRVFRELPVELHTLERIGRALGVDAWTLYLTADEPPAPLGLGAADDATDPAPQEQPETPADRLPEAQGRPARQRAQGRRFLAAVAVIGGVALLFGAWWTSPFGPQSGDTYLHFAGPAIAPPLGLGKPTVVVQPLKGDYEGRWSAALREALSETFNVAYSGAVLVTPADAGGAASLLHTDLGIDGEIVTMSRRTAVRFFAHVAGLRRQIWAESWPTTQFERRREAISARAAAAVKRAAGLQVSDEDAPGHFPLAPVQDDYLAGRLHLDHPTTELNIRRAQSRFAAALRQDANYARAHAGLCETLLEEHWMEEEQRALQDAALACGRALQLRPDDHVVRIAHAHFLRLTGRIAEAIRLFEEIIAQQPDDAFAMEGLATTHFHAFRQEGDRSQLDAAIAVAEQAARLDPLAWKVLSRQAQMYLLAGDLYKATGAIEAALARDENEHVLANAGSLQFCAGDVERARELYMRALEISPDSYIGEEFLGMLHYFLGEYEESARLRRRAIDRVAASQEPAIHEMWGNLADSYRQIGRLRAALDAYRRAVEIAERDFLRGTATMSDRVFRAYYYTMIRALQSQVVAGPAAEAAAETVQRLARILDDDIESELVAAEAEAIEPAAFLRLALAWMHRDDLGRARAAMERAMDFCVGYAYMPDLAALRRTPQMD